jgi:hypothetical protein
MHEESAMEDDKVCTLCSIPSSLRCGSELNLAGDFSDPMHVIKSANEFNDVIVVVKHLKCTTSDDGELQLQQPQLVERDERVNELREQAAQAMAEDARVAVQQDCCDMLRDIGPPWNWLHNFTSHNCRDKSYNFLERASIRSDMTPDEDDEEEEEEDDVAPQPSTSVFDDVQSSASGVSKASSEHQAIVEAICNLSTASEQGECNIRETPSIATQLCEQLERKQLEKVDYERLKKFIDRATENGIVFNDLNALYNYFIQESSREQQQQPQADDNDAKADAGNVIMPSSAASSTVAATASMTMETNKTQLQADAEVTTSNENVAIAATSSVLSATPSASAVAEGGESKNVVAIFEESGIEVDNKLLDAKVSERMILGLVDKAHSDIENLSDVASSNASMSSLSNAETVRQVSREKDTQTASYRDRIHERRLFSGQKSVSASSVKERQPYLCKIPVLPGIGPRMDETQLRSVLDFITKRSFEQGGFVYPRNFLEDDSPSLMNQIKMDESA